MREAIRRNPRVQYIQLSYDEVSEAYIMVLSDAEFSHTIRKNIEKEGFVVGVAFRAKVKFEFHSLSWLSRKQRRVLKSSASEETISAVITVIFGLSVASAYTNSTGTCLPIKLLWDSSQPDHLLPAA